VAATAWNNILNHDFVRWEHVRGLLESVRQLNRVIRSPRFRFRGIEEMFLNGRLQCHGKAAASLVQVLGPLKHPGFWNRNIQLRSQIVCVAFIPDHLDGIPAWSRYAEEFRQNVPVM